MVGVLSRNGIEFDATGGKQRVTALMPPRASVSAADSAPDSTKYSHRRIEPPNHL
jgi:hypothetical protein